MAAKPNVSQLLQEEHHGMPPKQVAIMCVYACVAIDNMSSALTVPILPFYVIQLGGTPAHLGQMFATFALAQIVATWWMGRVSDKIGRRPVLLVSLAGSGAGMLLSSLVSDYKQLFLARAFLGLFSGSGSVANAYIAEICSPAERPQLMARLGAMMGLAFMFGPPIGSGLAEMDIRAPFWVGTASSALAVMVAFFYLKNPKDLLSPETQALLQKMEDLKTDKKDAEAGAPAGAPQANDATDAEEGTVKWGTVYALGLASCLCSIASAVLMSCTALYVNKLFGFTSLQFGFIMMSLAITALFTQLLGYGKLTKALDKVFGGGGLHMTAVIGCCIIGSANFGFSTLTLLPDQFNVRFPVFVACQICFAMGMVLSSAGINPLLSNQATPDKLGAVMSVGGMTNSAGRVLGPIIYGLLYTKHAELAYVLAGSMSVLAIVVFGLLQLQLWRKEGVCPVQDYIQLQEEQADHKHKIAELKEKFGELLDKGHYDLSSESKMAELMYTLEYTFPGEKSMMLRGKWQTAVRLMRTDVAHIHGKGGGYH